MTSMSKLKVREKCPFIEKGLYNVVSQVMQSVYFQNMKLRSIRKYLYKTL